MYNFETLETTYFALPLRHKEATEILLPNLRSGYVLNMPIKPEEPDSMSRGILVVDDPALFVVEKRRERNSKEKTCHDQVVRLILGSLTDESHEYVQYNKGLQVVSWGSPEHRVKIVVVHDRKKAILQAARQGCAHIVKYLLYLKVGDEEGENLEANVLRRAIDEDQTLAVQTILHQITHVHIKYGQYNDVLQAAIYVGNEQMVRLLLDKGANVNAQGGEYGNALQAAAYRGNEQVVRLLLDKGANVNAQGGRYGNALQAASSRGHKQAVKLLIEKGADTNVERAKV